MTVHNREEKQERSRINVGQFADAIHQLHLEDIPPEQRAQALQEHMLKVQVDTLESPEARLGAASALAIRRQINKQTKPRPIEIYTGD